MLHLLAAAVTAAANSPGGLPLLGQGGIELLESMQRTGTDFLHTGSAAAAFVPTAGHKRPRPPTTLEVEPAAIAGAVATFGTLAWWLGGADERGKRANYAEWEAIEKERERLAYIEPREVWREEELAPYDGTQSDTGPILLAIKGDVFNVAKGRSFYGPGAEYHIMAGRDATRFLAKNRLEEERDEDRGAALNIAERANLEAWYWQLKNKYPRVGRLEGYDPSSTDM